MSPWSVGVRSLLKERPVVPEFLRGGRGVVTAAARAAAFATQTARAEKTKERVLKVLGTRGRWWTSREVAAELEMNRLYIHKVLGRMVLEGLIEKARSGRARYEIAFRTIG